LAVMLWIFNFVSLFISFRKYLRIATFILLYVCNLSSKSLFYSHIRYPRYFKICYLFNSIVVYHRNACRSRGIKVAAPALDSLCDRPITFPGDSKLLVKSSRRRNGQIYIHIFFS
jgi:hypothetical protein